MLTYINPTNMGPIPTPTHTIPKPIYTINIPTHIHIHHCLIKEYFVGNPLILICFPQKIIFFHNQLYHNLIYLL